MDWLNKIGIANDVEECIVGDREMGCRVSTCIDGSVLGN